MSLRLNKKAYNILAIAINKAAVKDQIAGEVSHKIALKRLQKLNSTKGNPVTEQELKDLISDLFPNFDSQAIKKAVRVNRPSSALWWLTKIALGLSSLAGLIWVLNLPYPMIRRPVAKTAPIILLPSYLRMDHNYRQAIAKVEQADQLVNRATSLADLKLGQAKVNQAQANLDALPVWFLGYEPQMYRTFFSFGWKFTFDEFEAARAKVGRMDAKIFQEINAFTKLEQAQKDIRQAKQNYQQAKDSAAKQQAISAWQAGIDKLNQLPSRTVAQEQAKAINQAYRRDFQQISGLISGNERTNKIIAAAQQFHQQGINSCGATPHSVNRWQECINLLRQAVTILQQVPLEDAGYLETQTLLANYEAKLGEMRIRQLEERESQQAYNAAQQMITNLPKSVNQHNRDRTAREILMIINELEKVKLQTTVYNDAVNMMGFANKKLTQLR
ncbi:MAG: hypothetical protein AAGE84_14575 [Cyanobacteria bacterium P01_G01_bin.39]